MIHLNPTDIAAEPAVAAATGPARARALVEQQIAMLSELARSGLSIAGAIERRALAQAEPGAEDAGLGGSGGSGDPAMAHARVARAVRLTLALQSRLLKDLIALDAAPAQTPVETAGARGPAADAVRGEPQDDPLEARRERIDRIVRRLVEDDENDQDEIERLASAAWERLSDEDVYGDLLARPMGEIVARICEDLDLSPDWTRLAREAWAVEEARSGAEGSPFVARAVSADPAPTPAAGSVGRSAPAGGSP